MVTGVTGLGEALALGPSGATGYRALGPPGVGSPIRAQNFRIVILSAAKDFYPLPNLS